MWTEWGSGEKPLSLGSRAWGSRGLGFRAVDTRCQNLLCAPLWAGGTESRLPALSRSQSLGLGHTGKRCHLLLLQRQSWRGGSQCRRLPALSAFPPSPVSPLWARSAGTSDGSEGRCGHCVPFQGMDPVTDILFSTLKVSFCGSKPCIFKKHYKRKHYVKKRDKSHPKSRHVH